jgi:hypothetical protein
MIMNEKTIDGFKLYHLDIVDDKTTNVKISVEVGKTQSESVT